MKSRYMSIICISAIIIGFVIGVSMPRAEATHQEDCLVWGCATIKMLEHILEEEQKQTALLDQIDCYNSYEVKEGWYPNQLVDKTHQCGKPLNYTGVWKH